jgi:hypothetical protein
MFYKYLLLTISLIPIISCHSNQTKKIIDLENKTSSLDINEFYSTEINKYKTYQNQNEEILFGKKDKDSLSDILQISDFYQIQTTSIFSKNRTTKDSELIGTQYNMLSYSPQDSLAKYGPVYFYKMDMMVDTTQNFMGLVALAENATDLNTKQLIKYISKKEGTPKEQIEDFFGEYKLYTWRTKENLLAVVSRSYVKENNTTKGRELFKEDYNYNNAKDTVILTYFYTIPLKYAETITQELYTGNWLFLKS